MKAPSKLDQLEAKLARRRRVVTGTALGRQLLAEYLDEDNPTSYRQLAKKHGISIGTVASAIRAAAREAKS